MCNVRGSNSTVADCSFSQNTTTFSGGGMLNFDSVPVVSRCTFTGNTADVDGGGLHNEGSQLLMQRLDGKITTDFDTARRLFTLICALHWKG